MAYMTPNVPPEGTPAAAAANPAIAAANLAVYVNANAGTFTDEALTGELIRAGYAAADIRSALAAARARNRSRPSSRAVRAILAAYGGTFVLLSAGMLVNHGTAGGAFVPTGPAGIAILAVSLLVALGLSAVWLASRRAFAIIALVVIALYALNGFSAGGAGITVSAVIEIACLGGVVLLLRRRSVGPRGQTALGVLLAIPVLLLLVVAGICVASGLPIPAVG